MAIDTLAFRMARQRVHEYKSESDDLMLRHSQAMECRDCEAFLQLGIDAFKWLMRADAQMRISAAEGQIEYDPGFDEGVRILSKLWLVPCEFAEKWAEVQKTRGYDVENLKEFRACCEEMRAIVNFDDAPDDNLHPRLIGLRDQALVDFGNGQTTEFI